MNIKELPYDKMDIVFKKIEDFITIDYSNYNDILNEEDLNITSLIYSNFKEDIDLYCKNNKVYDKDTNIKTFKAWARLMFIKDSRSVLQLLENVEKNWDFEDMIVNNFLDLGIPAELDGGDKDRKHSLFNFNSSPDLKVNGHYVEIQRGNNCFFKENKIKSCINKKSFILYFYERIEKFYLFNPKDLEILSKQPVDILYGFKKGRIFNIKDYRFGEFNEVIEDLKIEKIVKKVMLEF